MLRTHISEIYTYLAASSWCFQLSLYDARNHETGITVCMLCVCKHVQLLRRIPGEVRTAKEDQFHANLLRRWPGQTAARTSAARYTTDKKDLPAVSLPAVYIARNDSVIH